MTRDHRTAERIGATIAGVRIALGWSQRELARRAGVSQSWICRLERGRTRQPTLEGIERIMSAMGARLTFTVEGPHIAARRLQRDPAHARMAEHAARRLRRAGWDVATEVEVGSDRSRGWIDVVAWHPPTGVLLVIELKTELHDLGAIQRTLGWYEREAWAAARRLGWRPRAVRGCLLLLATDDNDARVSANRRTFASDFPVRARAANELVGGRSQGLDRGRIVAMVDPRSRRAQWLRPLRVDGRRSPAPYRDYLDFMRHLQRPRRTSSRGELTRSAATS